MKKTLLLLTLFISLFSFGQLTVPSNLQTYYNGVDFNKTGTSLFEDLAVKTAVKHTRSLSYSEIWDASKITDEDPLNGMNVLLIYGYDDNDGNYITDRSRSKNLNGGNQGSDWNREHTFPNSLANPKLETSGLNSPPYAEAHNLRPSDAKMNSNRGNLKFAAGSGNAGEVSGNWYPGDEWKGDAARIIMYMYLRYGNQCLPSFASVGTTNSIDSNMINLLLEWNAQDPVSTIEDNRNNYHGNTSNTYAQGNRNPFIDNPYLATVVWGGTQANNRWGNNPDADTEAPTVPTNIIASNITATTVDLNWTASTDNIGVTSYNIYVNGSYYVSTNSAATNTTVANLSSETTYAFSVLAADLANNTSSLSTAINATTLEASSGSGDSCVFETFDTMPDNNSSYLERSWTGVNGISWNAFRTRTDQIINGRAVAIDFRTNEGSMTSSTIANGMGSLTASTQRAFSGGTGTIDILVNGNVVGTLPYNETIQTTTISNINITGNVTVKIAKSASGADRVIIDDLNWTCYPTLSIKDENLKAIKMYPNPVNGNIIYFKTNKDITVTIYNILGQLVKSGKVTESNNSIDISGLSKNVYIVKMNIDNSFISKKLIKN
jgi:endonuclease I